MELNIISSHEKTPRSFERETQIFKVLNHPARLAILEILRHEEHCVCHMEAFLGLRQAYISQQLIVLREAGLIRDRRDGWNIFYQVTDSRIYAVLDAARIMTGAGSIEVHTSRTVCACPHCSARPETIS
ncbi:MAG: metalloregulator ArsR/SmtB family transcription factor [Anaerolineae bacterium]|nr:metalloregulator ArsR/SmtB family transcription factor [Anaerolineae bacterium]